jgi:hypothetical protein
MIKSTRKIKKRILATPAAAVATPRKPKTAAMIDTMKNIRAQYNMSPSFWSSNQPLALVSFLKISWVGLF